MEFRAVYRLFGSNEKQPQILRLRCAPLRMTTSVGMRLGEDHCQLGHNLAALSHTHRFVWWKGRLRGQQSGDSAWNRLNEERAACGKRLVEGWRRIFWIAPQGLLASRCGKDGIWGRRTGSTAQRVKNGCVDLLPGIVGVQFQPHAAGADAHQRTDLEQLEPDGIDLRLGPFGALERQPPERLDQGVSQRR